MSSERAFPIRMDLVGELAITQGHDYSQKWCLRQRDGTLWNTSGMTGFMRVRNGVGGAVLMDIHSYAGRLLTGTRGEAGNQWNLEIRLESGFTMSIPAWGTGVYQLMLKDLSGRYLRIFEGAVELSPNITPPVI